VLHFIRPHSESLEGIRPESVADWHVGRVSTPTLIYHGDEDRRVPMEQSEQLYVALRERNIPVEFVRYPGEGHGLAEYHHQLDNLERTVAWFDRALAEESKKPARPTRPDKKAYRPDDPAGDIARATGYKFGTRDITDGFRPDISFRGQCPVCRGAGNHRTCKFCALLLRMKLLMARVGDTKVVGGDRIRGIDFMYPQYGLAIAELFADYQLKRGEFREANRQDGHNILLVMMENICDRSNAIPGLPNWWIR